MQKLIGKGKQACARVLAAWRRLPVRVQGTVTVGLPLLAVTISALLAFIGNYQRAGIEADVQRKFQTTAALSEVLTLMVNAETGMRGYLLTQQKEFLEPFSIASQNLPTTMTRLRSLAAAEPAETPRLEKLHRLERIQKLIDLQLADLAAQQAYIGPLTRNILETDINTHLAYGKGLMDEIRAHLTSTHTEEGRMLTERIAEINAIRRRDFLAVFLVLIFGVGTRLVAWYLFKTGVLRRIKGLTENAQALRKGEVLPHPPSPRNDALGDLEHEIALAGKQSRSPGVGPGSDGSLPAPKQMRLAPDVSFPTAPSAATGRYEP